MHCFLLHIGDDTAPSCCTAETINGQRSAGSSPNKTVQTTEQSGPKERYRDMFLTLRSCTIVCFQGHVFLFVCLFLSACFFSGKSKVFPESSPRCHAGFARKKPSSAVILPLSELRVGLHFSLTASMCATVFRQTQTESYNSLFFSLSLHYNCIWGL